MSKLILMNRLGRIKASLAAMTLVIAVLIGAAGLALAASITGSAVEATGTGYPMCSLRCSLQSPWDTPCSVPKDECEQKWGGTMICPDAGLNTTCEFYGVSASRPIIIFTPTPTAAPREPNADLGWFITEDVANDVGLVATLEAGDVNTVVMNTSAAFPPRYIRNRDYNLVANPYGRYTPLNDALDKIPDGSKSGLESTAGNICTTTSSAVSSALALKGSSIADKYWLPSSSCFDMWQTNLRKANAGRPCRV